MLNERKYEKNYEENNNIIFNLVYKPNENTSEKTDKLNKLKEDGFIFSEDNEYTGEVFRIFGKEFIKRNKNKCKIIYKNKNLD